MSGNLWQLILKITLLSNYLHLAQSNYCLENCLVCSQANTCLQCTSSNYITIGSSPSKGCLPCQIGCLTCDNQLAECQSCSPGFHLDETTAKCKKCPNDNCLECDGQFPEICITCKIGYYLNQMNSLCQSCNEYGHALTCRQNMILSCQKGYYVVNGQTCSPCGNNCLICSSLSYCLSCDVGYYGPSCLPCHPTCETCLNSLSCLTCPIGKYLKSPICSPCQDSNCIKCNSGGSCLKCNIKYYLTSTFQCLILGKDAQISGCQSYASNQMNEVYCQTCSSNYYIMPYLPSDIIGYCSQCSLLCSQCNNFYQSSQCKVCSENAYSIQEGICYPKEKIEETGEKIIYINQWNHPKQITISSDQSNKYYLNDGWCVSDVYGKETQVEVGPIMGHNFFIMVKVGIAISQQLLTNSQLFVQFNGIKSTLGIVHAGEKYGITKEQEFFNLHECSTTHLYTVKINISSKQIGVQGTEFKQNNILRLFSDSGAFFLNIQEIFIQYKPCQESCRKCSGSACHQCRYPNMLIENQYCVDQCSQFYYLLEVEGEDKKCIKRCPVGRYPATSDRYWQCKLCPVSCSQCHTPISCVSCNQGYFLYQSTCLQICPHGFFSNQISNRCEPCSSPCKNCLSETICLSCDYNFLNDGTCLPLTGCPIGKYPDIQSLECKQCQLPCSKCVQHANVCQECTQGYLFENNCLSECPQGYVQSTGSSLQCLVCQYPCQTCQKTTDNCSSCSTGFLHNSQCLQNCPEGYLQIYSRMQCSRCLHPCQTCTKTQSFCLSCVLGYIYHQDSNQCILKQQCSVNSFIIFMDGDKCLQCPQQCSTCYSWQKCQKCSPGYYLYEDKCLKQCPFGYFKNEMDRQCQQCAQQCLSCQYLPNFCTICQSNYRMNQDKYCILGCDDGELFPTCQPCNSPCYTCEEKKERCTSCLEGYYLLSESSLCLINCIEGYYEKNIVGEKGGICEACKQPCQHCVNAVKCTQCSLSSGLSLVIENRQERSGFCVSICPQFYYLQTETNVCEPCIEPCLQCTSAISCTTCLNGIIDNNKCVSVTECPYGKYPSISQQLCLPCQQNCSKCLNIDTCIECSNGFFLQNAYCVENCELSRYQSQQMGTCEYCQFPCQTCVNSSTTCRTCQQPGCQIPSENCITFFLYKNQCLWKCPSQTFQSINDMSCLDCAEPCSTCIGKDICTTCLSNHYLFNFKCYQKCPDGFYPDVAQMECLKCAYPCRTCFDRQTCSSCLEGLKVDNLCLMSDSCPNGRFLQYSESLGSVCSRCSNQCQTCQGDLNFCLSCSNQSSSLLNGECLSSCPIGYYKTNRTSKNSLFIFVCQMCPTQCISCKSPLICQNCHEGYLFLNGRCFEQCLPQYYQKQNRCESCSRQCKTCVRSSTNCLSCKQKITDENNQQLIQYFYKFQCLRNCPLSTYADNSSRICRECSFPCQQCISSQYCLKCYVGYYLSNGLCIEECREPFIIDNKNEKCIETCSPNLYLIQQQKSTQFGNFSASYCKQSCDLPYIITDLHQQKCVLSCNPSSSSDEMKSYINQKLQCVEFPQQLSQDILTKGHISIFVNANYSLIVSLYFSHPITYNISNIKQSITLDIINSYHYSTQPEFSISHRNLVERSKTKAMNFQIMEQTDKKMLFSIDTGIFNEIDFRSEHIIEMKFRDNANLLVTNKISGIPLQGSSYQATIPANLYEPYNFYYQLDANYRAIQSYRVFGQIIVGFLLMIGLVMFLYNWYAKIYQSLHLLQLIFLLSVLKIRYPPNLYYFLQGFRQAHLYLIGNWFISEENITVSVHSTARMTALFGDINFLNTCGHLFCFLIVSVILALILFLCRFLPDYKQNISGVQQNQSLETIKINYPTIRSALVHKFTLIKWSHIHDIVMTFSMISFFGAMAQTINYRPESTIQTLSIILSWIVMTAITSYYIFMGIKLYRIVQLSVKDPSRFCDKNYLFRDNLMSITQSAVHPEELYLNYIRASRIIIFGGIIGLLQQSPLFCTGFIGFILFVSSLVYLLGKPYPDNTQNMLLGLSDLTTVIGLIMIFIIQSCNFHRSEDSLQTYIAKKWTLGIITIIILIVSITLLLIQLIVSVIRGNEGPQTLQAQQIERREEREKRTPKKLQVIDKRQFYGWQCHQNSGVYFENYDKKDEIKQ